MKENRRCFVKVMDILKFLARQGFALRGDGIVEVESNFLQVLRLRVQDERKLTKWLERKRSN